MNDEQLLRYNRHILLPEIDIDGQERLLSATVLVVGLGGLGCPVALYLASAGVGQLILADDDQVELSNLQRQIAHSEASLGAGKAESAAASARAVNSTVRVEPMNQRLEGQTLDEAVARADAVVDCSDNLATRFALNRSCFRHKKILVSGAAIRCEGQLTVYDHRHPGGPCYRCLYEESDVTGDSCSDSGVLAPLVGMLGSLQAAETVKAIAGFGTLLSGKLLLVDLSAAEFRTVNLRQDPACPVCSAV